MTATSTFAQDYEALKTAAGLVDRSERGKLALTGADAKSFLQGQLTNDTALLAAGTGLYAAFLTQKGKMQGDLRVLDADAELLLDTERVALQALFNMIRSFSLGHDVQGQLTNDTALLAAGTGLYAAFLTQKGKMQGDLRVLDANAELLLDTERVALQALFNMIRSFSLGHDVQVHKRTLESGLLSLIGPESDSLLREAGVELPEAEHSHVSLTVGGAEVRAIRTDLGTDLLFASGDQATVISAALAAGAVPVGDEAAECLRIESGRPRYGVDLDDSVIPQEAGLNQRAVSFTKGCYVGQETVARLFYKGKPNRELRGLRSDERLPVGTVLSFADREVATVTSSTVSPRLGPLALALVRREAPIDSVVSSGEGQTSVVSALPFS